MSMATVIDGTPLTDDALIRHTDLLVLRHLKFLLEGLEQDQEMLILKHIESCIAQYRKSHTILPPSPSSSPVSTSTPPTSSSTNPPLRLPRSIECSNSNIQELPANLSEEPEPTLICATVEGNDRSFNGVTVSKKRKLLPQTDLKTRENGSGRIKDKLRSRRYLRTVLPPIAMSIGSNMTHNEVRDRRYKFIEILRTLKVRVTKSGRGERGEIGFNSEEVIAITNFFFLEVLGPNVDKRLVDLVTHYARKVEDLAEPNPVEIVEILTEGEDIPDAVRELLIIFSNPRTRVAQPPKAWQSFEKLHLGLDLTRQWKILSDQVEEGNPNLLTFLERHSPRHQIKGRSGWRSIVKNYLVSILGLSNGNTVENRYHDAMGASSLVEKFGVGILLLLPPTSNSRLRVWGFNRMSAVYDSLATILPELGTICKLAEVSVYRYTRSEDSIPLKVAAFARQISSSSLEQILTELGTVIEGFRAKESA